MQIGGFTHLIFWQEPLNTLCFFAFAMAFLSLWIRKTAWLWGAFLAISYILALQAGIASFVTLFPLVILMMCHYFLNSTSQPRIRIFLFGVATAISFLLLFHLFPGFHNWRIASSEILSPGARPYSLWLNYDKPFIGFFALAFGLPLINSRARLWHVMRTAIPLSIVGIAIMMALSLKSGMIRWDPKIPTLLLPWIIDNLIFVSMAEEGFFRGFIQKGLYQYLGSNRLAGIVAIILTSLLFAALHYFWVPHIPFLALVFIASAIYGTIYQITKSIESSICAHFLLNLTHLLLFTYPSLTT